MIRVVKLNETYLKIICEDGIARELYDAFSFYVPGYKYMPLFKARRWDGQIHIFKYNDRKLYHGLVEHLKKFAEDRKYEIDFDEEIISKNNFSIQEAIEFANSLNVHSDGKPITPRDFQYVAFAKSIRNKRNIIISPTASGKSLISYLIVRYLEQKKGLIIVPTISLVEQLYSDFQDYSSFNKWDVVGKVHKIYEGQPKVTNKNITISTWQSLSQLPAKYFEQFEWVIMDECHLGPAKTLSGIMENLTRAAYRIGLTGSLNESKTHQLVLEGLFGEKKQLVTTDELIKRKQLSQFTIKCLILKYPEFLGKLSKTFSYDEELNYLCQLPERTQFITNLALSLKGNTLILHHLVDRGTKLLYNSIIQKAGNRKVFMVYADTPVEERERIRSEIEKETNAILVASYGTWSQGTNIKNLHNIILASSFKSKIRNLQSIGRGLRLGSNKDIATLYDIVDDLTYKKRENFSIRHFRERVKIYDEQKFQYKLYPIQIEVKDGKN